MKYSSNPSLRLVPLLVEIVHKYTVSWFYITCLNNRCCTLAKSHNHHLPSHFSLVWLQQYQWVVAVVAAVMIDLFAWVSQYLVMPWMVDWMSQVDRQWVVVEVVPEKMTIV